MATCVQIARRGDQVGAGLIEIERRLLQARDDAADALRLGRVLQHEGVEQRVAERLDVHRGIVQRAVDCGQVEQGEAGLVLQDGEIGAVLGASVCRPEAP